MNKTHRAMVTGAGGFVCSSITQALLSAGWQVIAVDQQFDTELRMNWVKLASERITFVQMDIKDLPSFEVDVFIHGAAITASPEELGQSPETNFRANIDPLIAALEWAKHQKVSRFLGISSSAVYAETLPGAVSETLPTSPQGLYAVAKQTMESLIATLRSEFGRDVATIRLSNVYGLDEKPRSTRPRVSLIKRMVQEAIKSHKLSLFRDDPSRDWTFAPDIGSAVVSILNCKTLNYALYNVASEQVYSPLDIAAIIQSLIPDVSLDIREGTNPNMPILTRRGYLSHERLQADTCFKDWTPFEEGIRQVIIEQQNRELVT